MTSRKLATFALCFLTSASSFAIGMRTPNLGGVADEDCGVRSNNGNANALSEVSCMLDPESCLHQAAWYQDRDNSMTPVSTEEGVGAAMAIFRTNIGVTQGVQVCPGVYLATAHGILNNPNGSNGEASYWDMFGYPMSRETRMELPDRSTMVSPRLRDSSNWSDPTTDYVFVTVDNPIRPNNFVRPVRSSDQRLIETSNGGEMAVHLYRPQTRFDTDSSGTPIFESEMVGGREMTSRYQAPLRVSQSCDMGKGYSGIIGSSCPNEQAVSGSPEVANINGQDLVVGMHIEGLARSENGFNQAQGGNGLLQSSHFCEDYESVCGQPCVELDEVLPQTDDGISL